MAGLSNLFETWQKGLVRLWKEFFRAGNRILVEKSFAGAVTILVIITVIASELLVYIWYRVLIGTIELETFLVTGAVTTSVSVPLMCYCVWVVKRANQNYDSLKMARQDLSEYVVKLKLEFKNRLRAEAELRVAKEQAEFASRSKSEFLANMSHELRTPLNAIIGFSEMMRLETFGPVGGAQYREYVRDIHESGTHLLSLINDILDLSKIEAGEFELKEEAVDVARAVSACRRSIKVRAKEGGLTLTTRLSGELPRLRSNERAVKQIILNLLSNAVKFTPAGGKVTVHAEIEEEGCFALSVSDTGIGIGADDIPKLFTPFSQVDSSVTRKHEGTGLGLSLVKSLVEMHGGTIKLESELGNGTIATVRFPAERVFDDLAKTKGDGVRIAAAE